MLCPYRLDDAVHLTARKLTPNRQDAIRPHQTKRQWSVILHDAAGNHCRAPLHTLRVSRETLAVFARSGSWGCCLRRCYREPLASFSASPVCEVGNAREFLKWPLGFLRLPAAAVKLFNASCVRRGKCSRIFEMAPGLFAVGAGGRRQAFQCVLCAKGEMLAIFCEMAPGILAAGAVGRRQAFQCVVCAKGEMLAIFLLWPLGFGRLVQAAAVKLFDALCVRRGESSRILE